MSAGWTVWTVLAFGLSSAVLWAGWRTLARNRTDFESRKESIRRLRSYRVNGFVIAAFVAIAVDLVTGFGTTAANAAATRVPVGGLVESVLLRWGVVVYGPLLVNVLAIHDATAPYYDSLMRRSLTRRESAGWFLTRFAIRTVPFAGVMLVVHWAPGGAGTVIAVAVAALAYAAFGPTLNRLLNDVREPTPEERTIVDAVSGPDDATVHVIEAADARQALGAATGIVPGFRAVFFTDYLFEELSSGEARAVVAHEYVHLRMHAPLRQWSFRAVCYGLGAWAWTLGVGDAPLLVIVGLAAYLYVDRFLMQRHEYDADRAASEQVEAEEMARALDRPAELAALPREYDNLEYAFATHPPTDERIRRLDPSPLHEKPPIPTRT